MLNWTPENQKIVKKIQRKVNKDITYRTDAESYPKLDIPEYWEIIRGRGYGDCDDYALSKRALLIESFPENKNDFRLATCWCENKEYHAVLVVDTVAGSFVLDNRHAKIQPYKRLGYKWHKIQSKDGNGWENLLLPKQTINTIKNNE